MSKIDGNNQLMPHTVTPADLATTGVTAGTYGSAGLIPVLTINAEGQITAASSVAAPTSAGRTHIVRFLPGPSADSGPDKTRLQRLPSSQTSWVPQVARLHVDSPSTAATTFQCYYSSSTGSAFGGGTALFSPAVSISGASSYEVTVQGGGGAGGGAAPPGTISTATFTGNVPGGALLAPSFTSLGGSNVEFDIEFSEQ